jgi:hypothetical protein
MTITDACGSGVSTALPADHCLLLISAPTDREVYAGFSELAQRWRSRLQHEELALEGLVCIEPQFASQVLPPAIEKVLAANCCIIETVAIDLGGLLLRFSRSGDRTPHGGSFFDELRLEVTDHLNLDGREVRQVARDVWRSFNVVAASGTPLFNSFKAEFTAEQTAGPEASLNSPVIQ